MLTEFATRLNIPVANTFMGKGVIRYTHPLALWAVGLQQRDYISCGFDRADLVIAVGYDLIEYSLKNGIRMEQSPLFTLGQPQQK